MEKVLGEAERPSQKVVLSQLKAEHAELESRLAEFDSKPYLTPVEQIERKRIQKLKLAKKDHIHLLMNTLES